MSNFLMCFCVGNHATCVHFGAGADHGEDAADRDDFAARFFKANKVLLPRLLLAMNGNRDSLGIIADRAAAYSKQ